VPTGGERAILEGITILDDASTRRRKVRIDVPATRKELYHLPGVKAKRMYSIRPKQIFTMFYAEAHNRATLPITQATGV
jgi:hypothetical protein